MKSTSLSFKSSLIINVPCTLGLMTGSIFSLFIEETIPPPATPAECTTPLIAPNFFSTSSKVCCILSKSRTSTS